MLTSEDKVIGATKNIVYGNMKTGDDSFDYSKYYARMEIEVESSVNTWFNNDAFGSGGKVNFNKFSYQVILSFRWSLLKRNI